MERGMPRVLLMADYSNFHATLAKGLRKLGCDVTVMSDGSLFMATDRDIDISRRGGKLGGLALAARLYGPLHGKMRGYDIVSFRDPAFLDLKPRRIGWFMKRLMRDNSACFLSYLSMDLPFMDMLESADSPLRYSEWFVDGKPNRLRVEDAPQWDGWHAPEMRRINDLLYANIRGTVTALYEYHLSAQRVLPEEKIAYGGIPIDVDSIVPVNPGRPGRVRIFLGRDNRRKLQKGSDMLEEAAKAVVGRHPDKAELIILENRPRDEYMRIMRSCHVLLDQIYSYTPATMALEGMASGLTAVTGGEPEYYDFIGEKENFPIVNAPIELEPLEKAIEEIVTHPELLEENSRKSRAFVEKHNALDTVARRTLDFWMKNIQQP